MAWRPLRVRDYLAAVVGGIVLGSALSGAAIAAATLLP